MRKALATFAALALALQAGAATAFCGFYVAKADTRLFNQASKVVLVHDQDRTVLTMANDFQGAPKDFAVVIPVPTFLERDQIHVGETALIDHLDAYSAPRLVQYFDEDPCEMRRRMLEDRMTANSPKAGGQDGARAERLGVKVEATYSVGEYDIVLLSAKQSAGLETWLRENGYRIPQGAGPVLASYLKQKLHFFVARVNLARQASLGYTFLRPIQIAYESPRFMLPIRLGTVNARGQQELFVFAITPRGRVETTNYRTIKLPTGMNLPTYLEDRKTFSRFYQDMFRHQVEQADGRAIFMEYGWDMNWCDPCAADPLSRDELKKLGVFWLDQQESQGGNPGFPGARRFAPNRPQSGLYLTRLHVRYDRAHFPEDLVFQETGDNENFQARYVMQHAWTGASSCPEAAEYRKALQARQREEARNLANLTGWKLADIRSHMKLPDEKPANPWWKQLWER